MLTLVATVLAYDMPRDTCEVREAISSAVEAEDMSARGRRTERSWTRLEKDIVRFGLALGWWLTGVAVWGIRGSWFRDAAPKSMDGRKGTAKGSEKTRVRAVLWSRFERRQRRNKVLKHCRPRYFFSSACGGPEIGQPRTAHYHDGD